MTAEAKPAETRVVQTTGATDDPDVLLMLECKRGDERAFRTLFEKYKRRIVNYARRFVYEPQRAEDVAQEVFLRLYRAKASYEPKTKFRTYLYHIATNTCLNHVRKRDWLVREDAEQAESVTERIADTAFAKPEEAVAGEELKRIVQKAIASLPEAQRTALLLLRFEDLSYEEIAAVMESSVPAVKSLLNRAKVELMKQLGPHLDGFSVPFAREP
jgi:RNA polymerase sigma-70 factor (ECF subfamily)